MQSLTLLLSFVGLMFMPVLATPASPPQTLPNPRRAVPSSFYLRTCATSTNSTGNSTDPSGSAKTGLYVAAYHTGAGTNDATLTSSKDSASLGKLDSDNCVLFNFKTVFPWGLEIVPDTNYAG